MRAPDQTLCEINTIHMDWDGGARILFADLSTLQLQYGKRIFRNAFYTGDEQGCFVVSERTGRKVLFLIDNVQYNDEGVLQSIELEPTEDVGVFKLVVFNN